MSACGQAEEENKNNREGQCHCTEVNVYVVYILSTVENWKHLHLLSLLSSFFFNNSLHVQTGVKQAVITSLPLVPSRPSHPYQGCDPTAPKHHRRTRTNPPRTTTGVDIRAVSCHLHQQKQENTFPTQTTRSLQQARHGNLHWSLPFKRWHH